MLPHHFLVAFSLSVCVTGALTAPQARADEDARVIKTTLAEKINLGSDAFSFPGVPGVGSASHICLSPDGLHCALLVHTAQNPNRFAVSIDGKAGREYESVEELQWDPHGQFLFIGKRDGKAYVVCDGKENTVDVADDIKGLVPSALAPDRFFKLAKTPRQNNELPTLDTLMHEETALNAPIYGAKHNGLWTLHGGGKLDGGQQWTRWLGTWPNGRVDTLSALYEVSDSKGATALVHDGKMLGPRAQWELNEDFFPHWSPDGAHVLSCIEHNKTNYLCLDETAFTDMPDYPSVHWSNDNHRFAVFGIGIKTSVLSIGADGNAKLDVAADWNTLEDISNPVQTGIVWSPDGAHFAAIDTSKAPATLWRDGVEVGALPPALPEKAETAQDREGRRVTALFNTGGVLVPLLSWNPTGTHLAVAGNGELDNGLYLDGKLIGKAGAFASLAWTQDGKDPVAIARDDEFADIIPISTWSLKSGGDTIEFALSSAEKTDTPLTRVFSPAKGIYRVVMLERLGKPEDDKADDEFARIVRYDIKLGR